MYISETTYSERRIISAATDSIFTRLDAANSILFLVQDAFFSEPTQKELSATDVASVRNALFSVSDMIGDLVLEYNLLVGNADEQGIKEHMASMHRAEMVQRVEALNDRVWKISRDDEQMEARRLALLELPDDQAAAGLKALLNE